jgi:hypothetical protein
LLIEDANPFSPISQLNYWYYENQEDISSLIDREKIQCIVGKGHLPFGQSQQPQLTDFPDGLDTRSPTVLKSVIPSKKLLNRLTGRLKFSHVYLFAFNRHEI